MEIRNHLRHVRHQQVCHAYLDIIPLPGKTVESRMELNGRHFYIRFCSHCPIYADPTGFMGVHGRLGLGPPAVRSRTSRPSRVTAGYEGPDLR